MIRSNFSQWELEEVKKLSGIMSKDALASHFGVTPYVFDKLRKKQPELEQAFQEGRMGVKLPRTKRFHEKAVSKIPQRVISEDPWVEFQKKFNEHKRKRSIRELKEYKLLF